MNKNNQHDCSNHECSHVTSGFEQTMSEIQFESNI